MTFARLACLGATGDVAEFGDLGRIGVLSELGDFSETGEFGALSKIVVPRDFGSFSASWVTLMPSKTVAFDGFGEACNFRTIV